MSSVFRLILTQNTAILRRGLTQITSGTIIAAQHHPTVNTNAFAVPPIRRFLSGTATLRCGAKTTNPSEGEEPTSATALAAAVEQNPLDRTRIITLEESLGYLASEAYQQTYGERPVWEQYRRNHKGPFAPRRTRKTCVRKGLISTGNPCPICRDEYLLLDHRNLELLHQFISPHTGEILSYSKTGLCQKKHLQLVIAIERARDQGLITFDVPFRQYDYADYYSSEQLQRAGIKTAPQ